MLFYGYHGGGGRCFKSVLELNQHNAALIKYYSIMLKVGDGCMYVRKTTIYSSEEKSLEIDPSNNPAAERNIPNVYLLGVFKILLAKYCEAMALDLGDRLMALHRTEKITKRAIRIGAWRRKGKEKRKIVWGAIYTPCQGSMCQGSRI